MWRAGELVLGLYEVLGVLGEGGMGRVYRVHHRGWDLDLAVKVPLPAVLDDAGGADLFEREAETWVNLGLHPHVVTCHYVRRVEGLPLVFAEYANGGSLHDAIRAGRLDSVEAILDVAIQIAWGLASRAPARPRPPGREARERHAHHGRPGEGHGLRPGPQPGGPARGAGARGRQHRRRRRATR